MDKISDLISLHDLKLNKKDDIILVFGSEGRGVSETITKWATHRVNIPPHLNPTKLSKYPFDLIDSLNVGASASIMMHHI